MTDFEDLAFEERLGALLRQPAPEDSGAALRRLRRQRLLRGASLCAAAGAGLAVAAAAVFTAGPLPDLGDAPGLTGHTAELLVGREGPATLVCLAVALACAAIAQTLWDA